MVAPAGDSFPPLILVVPHRPYATRSTYGGRPLRAVRSTPRCAFRERAVAEALPRRQWITLTGQNDGDELVHVTLAERWRAAPAHLLSRARSQHASQRMGQPSDGLDAPRQERALQYGAQGQSQARRRELWLNCGRKEARNRSLN